MNQAMILSVVRSVLIGAGGFLVAKGYISNEVLLQVVSAIVAVGAAVWGAVDKVEKP